MKNQCIYQTVKKVSFSGFEILTFTKAALNNKQFELNCMNIRGQVKQNHAKLLSIISREF